jgi:hypothetical protein
MENLSSKRRWPTAGEAVLDALGLAISIYGCATTPWLGAACLAIVGLAIVAHTTKRRPAPTLAFDPEGVRVLGWGEGNGVLWAELVEVGIVTTGGGPFAEDVFWILLGANGGRCAVPGSIAEPLLPRLQRLPGFDNLKVAVAMGSTEDASFRVWHGERGAGAVSQPSGTK